MNTDAALRFAALLTWLMTGLPTIVDRFGRGENVPRFWPWLLVWTAFGALFWIGTSDRWKCQSRRMRIANIAGQGLTTLLALWLRPDGFMPVLMVIVAAGMAHVMTLRASMFWMLAQTSIAFAILASGGVSLRQLVPIMGAYVGFQMFALFTAHLSISESEARAELALANAELRAASDLLSASSRTNERLRIARDLHDLLGHHLTALSVNMEVAGHLSSGRAKDHIEQAQSLAKLLLSDVRAVVSDLRDDQAIDVAAMLARLVEPIPRPAIELHVDPSLRVLDPGLAQTLLHSVQEIITNTMRHSGAARLTIDVTSRDGEIEVRGVDNGQGVDNVRLGNGLTGMRERADAAGGSLELTSTRGQGFRVLLKLPAAQENG